MNQIIARADLRIAQGDYTRQLEVGRRDELGELQAALERLKQSTSSALHLRTRRDTDVTSSSASSSRT